MTVGERIKISRESKDISQTELAKALNISKQNLYKYENNIITNIPLDKIEAIALYLNISPAYLMGWTSEPKRVTNKLSLNNHEEKVITAYRQKPEMQPAVDKLLGVEKDDNFVILPKVARDTNNTGRGFIKLSKEQLERLHNATPVESDDDL